MESPHAGRLVGRGSTRWSRDPRNELAWRSAEVSAAGVAIAGPHAASALVATSAQRDAEAKRDGRLGAADGVRRFVAYLEQKGNKIRVQWESAMEARQLITGASFGPEALRVIGHAFDAAWVEIAGNFGDDPAQIEAARLKLATAILAIANEDSRDVEVLKKAAIEQMATDYRVRRQV
jgi:hypothetical protein